jgi:hypothetical protein
MRKQLVQDMERHLYDRIEAEIGALDDPEQSFAAAAYPVLGNEVAVMRNGKLVRVSGGTESPAHQLLDASEPLDVFMHTDVSGGEFFMFTDAKKIAEAVRQRYSAEDDPAYKAGYIITLGFIAAALQPADPAQALRRRRPHETSGQKGYRTAASALRNIAVDELHFAEYNGQAGQAVISAYRSRQTEQFLAANGDNPDALALYNEYTLRNRMAGGLLDLVQDPRFTGERFQKQFLYLRYIAKKIAAEGLESEEQIDPLNPSQETGWKVLPHGVLTKLGLVGE